MRTSPTFRPLSTSDLAAARRLWAEADGVELAEGDSEAELTAYLARNPGMSYAALAGDELVGAVLAGHDGRRGLLYHLAVSPAHRGGGTGRRLVELALERLHAAGIARVLILVAADNAGGRAFWRRLGWEDIDLAEPMAIDLPPPR